MILFEKTKEQFGYDFETVKVYSDIFCVCDYCGIEFTRTKRNILVGKKILQKDSCSKCTPKKREESQRLLYGDNYKELNKDKAKNKLIEKYGCNPTKLPEIKEKIKKTCLKKYGTTSYLSSQEMKEIKKKSCLEKYGTEYATQSESVKTKTRKTNISRYGTNHPSQTQEWKDGVKNTCQERYGVDSVMQTEIAKENLKKAFRKKYGVDHALQDKKIMDRFKATCLDRYGVESYSQTDECKERKKATCLKRYGVPNPLQNKDILLKAINTNIKRYGTAYPLCKFGKTENEIKDWLSSLGFPFVKNYSVLGGKELDLYNENLKLAIEYCGLYWHNEFSPEPRTRSYHYEKFNKCNQQGIRLITIFEDEWRHKQEHCKDFIKSILRKFSQRIMARKCKIEKIDNSVCNSFCEDNHIMGGTKFKAAFGLFDNNELLGIIGLSCHHRKVNKEQITLNRLCFKKDTQIIGGASKLFAQCITWAKDNNYKEIISWSDNRWSDGNIYKNMQFKLDGELPPDYSYVDCRGHIRINKQSCKKKNIGCPTTKTEKQWMLNNGFARIWDCGKKRWIFNI
jgi:hypothetical protein